MFRCRKIIIMMVLLEKGDDGTIKGNANDFFIAMPYVLHAKSLPWGKNVIISSMMRASLPIAFVIVTSPSSSLCSNWQRVRWAQ